MINVSIFAVFSHRIQNLFYLHLFTEVFRKNFPSVIRTNTSGLLTINMSYIHLREGWGLNHPKLFFILTCININWILTGSGRLGLNGVNIWFEDQSILSYCYVESF